MTARFTPAALLFDFDGVLVESESAGNRHVADWLTQAGHPTTADDAMTHFMGLSGAGFTAAIEHHIGAPLPEGFAAAREIENERALREGVGEVAGAIAFVRALPPGLPRAIVSSSTVAWIDAHLRHIGLREAFGAHLYSGKEHVARGKPHPDLYLHGAAALGIPIEACAIIEDSPIGVTGAAKTGAFVIGLCAGEHCAVDHAQRLTDLGADAIATDFTQVAELLGFSLK